jgi:hypothetical protein
MSKLDVGVGDAFPADETRRDEDGVVHHHHYHGRRRGPFRVLRIVLVVMLISLAWRLVSFATYPSYGWHGSDWQGSGRFAGYPFGDNPFYPIGGMVVGIVAIGAALWFLRRQDNDSSC